MSAAILRSYQEYIDASDKVGRFNDDRRQLRDLKPKSALSWLISRAAL
jgi:hypothetical protein